MRHSFHFRLEREARPLHENGAPKGAETSGAPEKKNVIESLPEDMRAMFRYFAEVPNVNQEALDAYFLSEKEGPLTPAETDLKHNLDVLSGGIDATPAEKSEASRKVEAVLADINARNKVIADNKAKLRDFEAKHENIPSLPRMTYETSKKGLGIAAEAFAKADWKDRGIMLAGVVSGVLIMRALWQKIPGTGKLKKFAMIIGGGLLTLLAFETFNKATEKVTGKPFMSFDRSGKIRDNMKPAANAAMAFGGALGKTGKEFANDIKDYPDALRDKLNGDDKKWLEVGRKLNEVDPATRGAWQNYGREAVNAVPGTMEAGKESGRMFPLFSDSQEQWDARKHEMELKELEATLDEIDFPDDFMAEIDAVNARMAPTVATVAPMSAEEFLAIYESGRYSKAIESIPSRKLPADKMTPEERFAVIEDIAKTLNLVDRDTGEPYPLPKERQGASMFLLMMDWKHIPEVQERETGSGER